MGSPRESRADQVATILERLYDSYPDATISLDFSNRLELFVAVVLSAQCTDERVNQETPHLFETYPSVEAYANADQDELAEALNSITYFNSKARYLRESCQRMLADHDGQVPDAMDDLTDLPGVGRKTANVILQHGHDVVEGIVVDTHVQRLSRRLGVTEEERPEAIEDDLMDLVPEDDWQQWTHLLIAHGRAVCTARSPACEECVLEDICPSSWVDSEIDMASGDAWN